jgi:GDP-L-fucose synthase
VFLMGLDDERFGALLGSDESRSGVFEPPLVNIGVGEDVTIAELAELVRRTVGFEGGIVWDRSKPDGTPRKLMDVSRLREAGFASETSLRVGLERAYADFLRIE